MKSKQQVLEDVESFGLMTGLTWVEPLDKDIRKLFAQVLDESDLADMIEENNLGTGKNLDLIIAKAKQKFGPEFGAKEFLIAATPLVKLGLLEPREEPEAVPEPEVDSLGRPITEHQRKWQAMADWSNDPQTSSRMIADRRRSDPEYAKFHSQQTKLRVAEEGVGDAVTAVGTEAVRQDKSIKRTEALRLFSQQYRKMSADEVRRLSSPAGNPFSYKGFVEEVENCIRAGLL